MQTGITLSLIGALFALIGFRQRDAIKPELRAKLSRMWWHYCWGVFSAGLNGAVLAIKGTLGVAAGAAFNPQTIQAPNVDMAFYLFGVAFALNGLDWFTKNPLPTNLVETTTTTETTTETKTETAKSPAQ
jgi:energy-converting hydrogenase Eha subunit E